MPLPQFPTSRVSSILPQDKKRRLAIIVGGAVVLSLVIAGLVILKKSGGGGTATPCLGTSATLSFWGERPAEYFRDFTGEYEQRFCVKITYQQIEQAIYHDKLVRALAAGEGPDIILLDSDRILTHRSLFAPAPFNLASTINLHNFPQGIVDNLSAPEPTRTPEEGRGAQRKLYGLPVSADALVLFWNPDLLFSAGYTRPPETWQELAEMIPSIRRLDHRGNFLLAPIALGTILNVTNSLEILSTILWQHNAPLPTLSNPRVQFTPAFSEALQFYTQFINPASFWYSWNAGQENDLEAFAKERVVMMLGFFKDRESIRQRNPRLTFRIGAFPNFAQAVKKRNYAKFNVLTVAKNSRHPKEAWEFIVWMTSPQMLQALSKIADFIPPRLDLLPGLSGDATFVGREILVAQSWLIPEKTEFAPTIDTVLKNIAVEPERAGVFVQQLEFQLNNLINPN